jgi:LysM repeat protein
MERRTSAPARIFAALALLGAVLVVVVVIASGTGGDSSSEHPQQTRTAKHEEHRSEEPPPATYVVQTGDTLTSIAHETGVPVAEILALNPEVDPQILIAGEKLKLR